MDASERQQIESYAVVSKDKEGKLTVRDQSKTGQGETATPSVPIQLIRRTKVS